METVKDTKNVECNRKEGRNYDADKVTRFHTLFDRNDSRERERERETNTKYCSVNVVAENDWDSSDWSLKKEKHDS